MEHRKKLTSSWQRKEFATFAPFLFATNFQGGQLADSLMEEDSTNGPYKLGPPNYYKWIISSYTNLQPMVFHRVCWGYNYLITRPGPILYVRTPSLAMETQAPCHHVAQHYRASLLQRRCRSPVGPKRSESRFNGLVV